jgi:2-polyprenyl-3-methyl-5-hydroxy-6-metoxy-1,4-benzoquinol methylase
MTTFAVRLFSLLQSAEFYSELHVAAAELMVAAEGRSWLDVGCGPGLLTRIAAGNGFVARGVDRDADMIDAARKLAETDRRATFATSDIAGLVQAGERFDVVSASSLVVVTPNPSATLRALRGLVKPHGRLLVIEASPDMSRSRALRALLLGSLGKRGFMLLPWALARSGRALPDEFFRELTPAPWRHRLLGGMVNAWIYEGLL